MVEKTFVHEGTEVKLTGRIAIKDSFSPLGTVVTHKLVEIQPVDEEFSWKKWVDEKSLFHVKQAAT